MPPSSLLVLLTARAAIEGFALAVAAWLCFALLGGMVELARVWLLAAGAALALAAAGRALLHRRGRLSLALVALAGGAAASLWVIGAPSEPVALAGRALSGVCLGALAYWRGMAIAVAPHRWREMAFGVLASIIALGLAAAISSAVAGPQSLLAIVIAVGAGAVIGLSAARSAEESLFVDRRGSVRSRPAVAGAIVIGLAAIVVAGAFPTLGIWLAAAAQLAEPFITALLILVVTPFLYVAEWLVRALLPLLRAVPLLRIPLFGTVETSPADDAEYARQLALQAEIFLRVLVALIAAAIVAALVLHAASARRVSLPAGASLEREPMPGSTLGRLLRRLLSASGRPARPRGGSPDARIRRAYWDMLDLAERVGRRWRERPETPREHLVQLGTAWAEGEPIVAAFERARYSGRATEAHADEAERALGQLGASLLRRT